jgi:hypothetical protein
VRRGMGDVEDWQLARAASHMSTGLPSAEAQVLDRLPDSAVQMALEALPEQFRMAVYLADVEDFADKEIADISWAPPRHGHVPAAPGAPSAAVAAGRPKPPVGGRSDSRSHGLGERIGAGGRRGLADDEAALESDRARSVPMGRVPLVDALQEQACGHVPHLLER